MSEHTRPDPDALLAAISKREGQEGRGRLKVFLGMSAGVGKTYAMLSEARELKARGFDVVIGVAETHGRPETEALREGFETIPPRHAAVGPTVLPEFSLEAALERRPELVLLDELAHSNAPGSRHAKRWQDALDLLHAGIDVYTCLNVQHVESLNDVVAQVTGVTVRETVPDAVLDQADRIELVDLPPDELLQRLHEGKVYVPDQARQALSGFFRPGNLMALRDLALRQTAQRVEADMETYRTSKAITDIWPAAPRVLAAYQDGPSAVQVIRTARRMASAMHAECLAVHVRAPSLGSASDGTATDAPAPAKADALGMATSTISCPEPARELLRFARSRNVSLVVVARREPRPPGRNLIGSSLADALIKDARDMEILVVAGDAGTPSVGSPTFPGTPGSSRTWLGAIGSVAASTGIGYILHSWIDVTNLVMVYLAGVTVVAARAGPAEGVFTALAGMLAFDFCFVPPRYTFAVSDIRYVVTFAIMVGVSLLISSLSGKFRLALSEADERERRTSELYALGRELTRAHRKTEIADAVRRRLAEVLGVSAGLLYTGNEPRRLLGTDGCPMLEVADERAVAEWVSDHGEPAGNGTTTLPGAEGYYVPLNVGERSIGAIGVFRETPLDAAERDLIRASADLAALALERTALAKQSQAAHLAAEQEKLRSALLSSVSHDLRTPLTAVVGASETLLTQEAVDAGTQRELVSSIHSEATRLSRLVSNLLQMTRLDTGHVQIKGDWLHVEEVIAGALDRAKLQLTGRRVVTRIEPCLPLLHADPILLEQVVVNLLENAVRYSPADTPIELWALPSGSFIRIEVRDNGPGFPAGMAQEMFGKFTRGPNAKSGEGFGLGLAICKAIVEAHGGRIWARTRPEGGASVIMEFRMVDMPPVPVANDE